jgi:hypothetical protein
LRTENFGVADFSLLAQGATSADVVELKCKNT